MSEQRSIASRRLKTHVLNATAGLTLIAGTILLARFVAMTA